MNLLSEARARKVLERAASLQRRHVSVDELYKRAEEVGIERRYMDAALAPTVLEAIWAKISRRGCWLLAPGGLLGLGWVAWPNFASVPLLVVGGIGLTWAIVFEAMDY